MKFPALFTLLLSLSFDLFATWSIIVIDPKTNEIGIAGASCSPNCYGIGGIIPAKGAIIVQAMSNKQAKAKGMEMIRSGAKPEQIISALRNPMFDPERQQYAVVTVSNISTPLTYTGNSTSTFNGSLTAKGISVQGNTLADSTAFRAILEAALSAQSEGLEIEEILMRALEAGSSAGGDKRCGDQKATSAFITVFRADDRPSMPFLELMIFGQPKGGQNAVAMLRRKYDKWRDKKN